MKTRRSLSQYLAALDSEPEGPRLTSQNGTWGQERPSLRSFRVVR